MNHISPEGKLPPELSMHERPQRVPVIRGISLNDDEAQMQVIDGPVVL